MEEQAIDLFKAGIEAELTASAPRFEEAFREEVEQRIFQSAKEPTFWQKLQTSVKALLRPVPMFRVAGAAAAFGVMMIAVVSRTPDPEVIAEALPGCLLYTSDAADERYSVDLGGRFNNVCTHDRTLLQWHCLLYTSPSPRDRTRSRMPSSA